jgi:hypothetical protein
MIEWNIQARAHACQACERAFSHGQSYHTILFDERLGYVRVDVCEDCWGSQYGQGATSRKGFISHWQGVFELPPAQPEPIRKETAETLLRKLVERNDAKFGAACFILAVMLERKRVFKVKEQFTRDGRRIFVYEHAKTGDAFTITDPGLQLNQLDEVQRDVAHLLEHGLDPAAEPGPAAGGSGPAPDSAAGPAVNERGAGDPGEPVAC